MLLGVRPYKALRGLCFLAGASHPALERILLCASVLTCALSKGSAICYKMVFIARTSVVGHWHLPPENKCRIKTWNVAPRSLSRAPQLNDNRSQFVSWKTSQSLWTHPCVFLSLDLVSVASFLDAGLCQDIWGHGVLSSPREVAALTPASDLQNRKCSIAPLGWGGCCSATLDPKPPKLSLIYPEFFFLSFIFFSRFY